VPVPQPEQNRRGNAHLNQSGSHDQDEYAQNMSGVVNPQAYTDSIIVDSQINSQTFDTKPGFDRSKKKVHTREKLKIALMKKREALQQSKQRDPNNPDQGGRLAEDGDDRNSLGSSNNAENDKKFPNFLEEELSSHSDNNLNSQDSNNQEIESDKEKLN
jgi:hypothetical protein